MIATKKAPGWSLGIALKEADSAHRAALAGLKVGRLDRFVARSGFLCAQSSGGFLPWIGRRGVEVSFLGRRQLEQLDFARR